MSNFDEFIKFYNSVKNLITIKTIKKANIKKGIFTDKTIVLSGFRDAELQAIIEVLGGKIGTTVSKNTNYVVVKEQNMIDDPTEKIKKAVLLNVEIITKKDLQKLIQ